jgi:hypothetical protein
MTASEEAIEMEMRAARDQAGRPGHSMTVRSDSMTIGQPGPILAQFLRETQPSPEEARYDANGHLVIAPACVLWSIPWAYEAGIVNDEQLAGIRRAIQWARENP